MKTQKSILPTKAKWVSKIIGFSLLSIPLMSNLTHAQSPSSVPQIGFNFKQSQEFNVGVITEDIDSGGCHSQSYSRNETAEQATFISSNMPPAPGLRVKIRNVTPRIDQNPSPYTDREYDKPPTSEGFKVSIGTIHSGRFLSVQPGKNHFSYEIKRGNTIIESGTFTARIDHKTQSRERDENLFECQREYNQQREFDQHREFDPTREFDPMRQYNQQREFDRQFDRQEDKPRRR